MSTFRGVVEGPNIGTIFHGHELTDHQSFLTFEVRLLGGFCTYVSLISYKLTTFEKFQGGITRSRAFSVMYTAIISKASSLFVSVFMFASTKNPF